MFHVRSIRIPVRLEQGRGSNQMPDIRKLEKILIGISFTLSVQAA